MPAQLHAADFQHWNGDKHFDTQMDRVFDYYRTKDPGFDAKLQTAHDQGIYFMDNSPGNPLLPTSVTGGKDLTGQDLMLNVDGHPTIAINMNTAVLVASGGKITGIESVASAVYHELISHGSQGDANDLLQGVDDGIRYDTFNEHVAISKDDLENALTGEAGRDNHRGVDVFVGDVTAHTIMGEDGQLILVRMGADGKDEYGPQIDYASKTWQHLESVFKAAHGDNTTGSADGTVDDVVVTGNLADGYSIVYDDQGNPVVFHNPDVPNLDDPNAPVVLLDPHNSNGPDGNGDASGNDGGGDGDFGCVAIASFLPDDRRAGSIEVGNTMQLADQDTLEAATGIVGYSQQKEARGYRIVTESGASLVCSDTAPIPVKDRGLMKPDHLLAEQVAVRRDEHNTTAVRWEKVVAVEEIGRITVQHITVGNKCFWAGERKGAYILHHNAKMEGGGGGGGDDGGWWFFDDKADITRIPSDGPAAPHHMAPPGAHVVGVPPPIDGVF